MEALFKIKEKGSSPGAEILAGLTSFLSVICIIFVVPEILSATGMPYTAVLVATCLACATGCFLTALISNLPLVRTPALGMSAFFAYSLCNQLGYTWPQALTIVLISGALCAAAAFTPFRDIITSCIPEPLKKASLAGIGLFIAFIGLSAAGIVTTVDGRPGLGSLTSGNALLAIIGLAVTSLLIAWKIKGAMFFGIIITSIIGIPLGVTGSFSPGFTNINLSTFLLFDFKGILSGGIFPLIISIMTLCLFSMFSDKKPSCEADSDKEKTGKAAVDLTLLTNAAATCSGAVFGMPMVLTHDDTPEDEDETGLTGFSSFAAGLFFLLAIPLALFGRIVPGAAVFPVFVITGIRMLKSATDIDWGEFETALPCFITIAATPFAYSIPHSLGMGLVFHTLIKLFRGKAKEVPVAVYIVTLIFIAFFIFPQK
ncbi:MAG: NCS2 family permease [Oscillospiraceae bacterium]|nr:NCS2 family permease [Oscillospiraceae bacterium]